MAKSKQSSPTTNIGIIKGIIAIIVIATICSGWLTGRLSLNLETLVLLLGGVSQMLSTLGFIKAEDAGKILSSRFGVK